MWKLELFGEGGKIMGMTVSRFLLELQGPSMRSLERRIVCSLLVLTCEQVTRSLTASNPKLEAVVSVEACWSLSGLLAHVRSPVN